MAFFFKAVAALDVIQQVILLDSDLPQKVYYLTPRVSEFHEKHASIYGPWAEAVKQ